MVSTSPLISKSYQSFGDCTEHTNYNWYHIIIVIIIIISSSSSSSSIVISLLRVFHTSVSKWFFTGVRVTASLIKSLGLFLVFWPISTILLFGWSPLVLLFPSPPVPLPILWWLYRVLQLQLVSPSPSCSIGFSVL